jgi:large subunit ribosomal protein L15
MPQLTLHTIKPFPKSKKPRKRVGRGLGSHGTYSGRGQKGQRARSGGKKGLKLKGIKKMLLGIPKMRGFRSPYSKETVVNVGFLDKKFKENDIVTPQALLESKLIDKINVDVKILGDGEITKKLVIKGCAVSRSAKEKIEKAGGIIK